jgi:tyrosinase
MTVIRKNILSDTAVRDDFVRGVTLLKQENSGFTTSNFGIPGAARIVSTYDLFVIWHHQSMLQLTPPGNPAGRNAAHRGPVFPAWHRVMLLLLEANLQRVLANSSFGLPYWDWATDGDLPSASQPTATLWTAAYIGGSGSPVSNGPFAYSSSSSTSWRVRIETNIFTGDLQSANRGLNRDLAGSPPAGVPTLPTTAQATGALNVTPYDAANWDVSSAGFRNQLEGWNGAAGGLHNRIHQWVSGDMSASTSPNDPVFYLNHCNVDRLWEGWLTRHGRVYLPGATASTTLRGHRINDPIASPLSSTTTTPGGVLSVSANYSYDVLP